MAVTLAVAGGTRGLLEEETTAGAGDMEQIDNAVEGVWFKYAICVKMINLALSEWTFGQKHRVSLWRFNRELRKERIRKLIV